MSVNTHYLWDKVIKAAASLPEIHEKPCHGTAALYVHTKLLCRLKEDAITLAVYNNDRDEWIATDPDTFFFTDHYKDYPMVLVDLERVSFKDLQKLLLISWKIRAPKKIQQAFKS